MDQGTPAPIHSTIDLVARLADEGIPICAIARTLKLPSADVRDLLHQAMFDGAIVEYPKEDWPPGSRRNNFALITDGYVDTDDKLRMACARYFHTTKQQSIVLAYLLKRAEATKEQLHQAIESSRGEDKEPTDPKLVDVLVCIIRKKLREHELSIKTMWGRGYLMDPKERARTVYVLNEFMRQSNSIDEVRVEEEKEAA
jgi:DNA-binding winged helix-turn-helix (wHTH) protein